jgi:hypothetical protein
MISGSAQHLSYLFDTAIKSGQQEILDWYNYSLEFESKVDALTADGRIKDKTARSMIYKEMKPFLPKITQDNLRKKTLRARKHLMLFGKNGVGIDKIKLVSYSATEISKLNNAQIQNVIDQVKKYTSSDHQSHVTLKTVPSGNDQIKAEVNTLANILSESQSKPTYDRTYFQNKTLDQYPNLYREFSSEDFDYYGITDETLCPLCKLDHDDEEGIDGRYEAGSYFIKYEQCEIEISA